MFGIFDASMWLELYIFREEIQENIVDCLLKIGKKMLANKKLEFLPFVRATECIQHKELTPQMK